MKEFLYIAIFFILIVQVLLFVGSHEIEHGVYAILLQGVLHNLEKKE